jgi:copper(I)-binding protein
MKNKIAFVLAGVVLGLIVGACASNAGGGLEITDAWARPTSTNVMDASTPAMGSSGGEMAIPTSAIYMKISNTGSADKLIQAQTDVAQTVELHTVTMEGGVMQMRPVAGIDIPTNSMVQLKPGGFHVMLIGVKKELKVGDTIAVTLTFEKAGTRQLQAQVRAQ